MRFITDWIIDLGILGLTRLFPKSWLAQQTTYAEEFFKIRREVLETLNGAQIDSSDEFQPALIRYNNIEQVVTHRVEEGIATETELVHFRRVAEELIRIVAPMNPSIVGSQ